MNKPVFSLKMPSKCVGLHPHYFNARYFALKEIIANAIEKHNSRLADLIASILDRLVGSSFQKELKGGSEDEAIQEICAIADFELISLIEKVSVGASIDELLKLRLVEGRLFDQFLGDNIVSL